MGFYKEWINKLKDNFIGKFIKNKKTQQFFLAIIFFISIFSILVFSLKPEKFDLVIGERAPEDIISPKDIENKKATEKLREEASESVELIYSFDAGVHIEVKKDIENFFKLLYKLRDNEEIELEDKKLALEEENHLNLNKDHLRTALTSPLDKVDYLETYIYEIVARYMNTGIKVENLQKEKSNIKEYILELEDFNEELQEMAIAIIHATIRPNMFFDIEATEELRTAAIESVEKVVIKKGDIILKEGEIVTYDDLQLLRELSILTDDNTIDIMLYLGIASIVLVLELLIIAYIYVFNREILQETDKLLMILLIILATMIISKAISMISIYLMPVAVGAMLISILVETRLALLINLCLTILTSIIVGNDIIFIIMTLLGGTVGVLGTTNVQKRTTIFLSGLMVSIVSSASIIGVGFIITNELTKILIYGFYGFLNGFLSSILTLGTLPLWEHLFRVVTPLKLVELFNPNEPLLKRLLIEAPGTYHHSIIVGNLSESAASAIGANPLLARVGAFYHDIGKIKRPYFFKENQLTSENPHDKLNPSLSSLIITGHVKEGLELAKKYKLPIEVRNFIEQHHGDTLVAYFYHKAKNSENGENVDEQSFRYAGPKPQSKEVAIVMLADSVEAAVRSIASPSKEKIEDLVNKIIQGKLMDRQLEETNLTLKELEIIKKTFTKGMLGIFHERIEYPDTKEVKERKAYGTSN